MNLHFNLEYTGCCYEARCLNQETEELSYNFGYATNFVYKIRMLELEETLVINSVMFSSNPKLVIFVKSINHS